MNLLEGIQDIPTDLVRGFAISMVCLSVGVSVALARSSGLQVSKDSLRIERQAAQNQAQLEKANQIIKTQDEALQRVKATLTPIVKQSKKAQSVVNDINLVRDVIPQTVTEDIGTTVQESKELLNDSRIGNDNQGSHIGIPPR